MSFQIYLKQLILWNNQLKDNIHGQPKITGFQSRPS